MTKKDEQLSQREWDRIVGWGKAQPPSPGKKVISKEPFTNHKPTYDRAMALKKKKEAEKTG